MTIKNKATKMLLFNDFYGGDLISLEDILNSKTNKDLKECLQKHYRYLEDQNIDALSHLDRFMKELDLF